MLHQRKRRCGVDDMVRYCFDIDGTLCSQESGDYLLAKPFENRVEAVNRLFDEGHEIVLFTARGSKSGLDWSYKTEMQIRSWGLRHHELLLGKPHADLYIDDKALHPDFFDW